MSLDVIIVNGPQAGAVISVDPSVATVIGRLAGGVQLHDALVSIRHAELSFDAKRNTWLIRDLGSVTGTFLDGRPVGTDPVPVGDGHALRIGETDLRLRGHSQWRLRQAILLTGPTAVVVSLAAIYLAIQMAGDYPPLPLPKPAVLATGMAPVSSLQLPDEVVREIGADPRRVAVRNVTDADRNGVAELWVAHPGGEAVVAYAPDGTPKIVGRLPLGCTEGRQEGWPSLKCGAETWMMDAGRYRPVDQVGVVAWMRARDQYVAPPPAADGSPPPPPPAATALVVSRVDLPSDERVAGFLARRGVQESAHWILCEGFRDGLLPQALQSDGTLVTLGFPCGSDLEVAARGDDGAELWRGKPLAIALTPQGRVDLLDELTRWTAGHPSGLFASPADAAWLGMIAAPPAVLTGRARLESASNPWPRTAVAVGTIPEVPRRLALDGAAPAPAPRAGVATLLTAGALTMDVPGCANLNLDIAPWTCAIGAGCLPGATFVRVTETGCGAEQLVLQAPYSAGRFVGRSASYEYVLELGGSAALLRRDVYGARLSWRPLAP